LDAELQRRRKRSKMATLKSALTDMLFKAVTVVQAVNNDGAFTLSFSGLQVSQESADNNGTDAKVTTQVPSNFIGPGGVVAEGATNPRRAHRSGGLFGGPGPEGLFGDQGRGSDVFDDEDNFPQARSYQVTPALSPAGAGNLPHPARSFQQPVPPAFGNIDNSWRGFGATANATDASPALQPAHIRAGMDDDIP